MECRGPRDDSRGPGLSDIDHIEHCSKSRTFKAACTECKYLEKQKDKKPLQVCSMKIYLFANRLYTSMIDTEPYKIYSANIHEACKTC